MSKGLVNVLLFCAGCLVLYFIAGRLISDHKVPTLEEYLASSTTSVIGTTASSSATSSTKDNSVSSINYPASNIFKLPSATLFSSKGSVKVFIADTDATREQGLSDVPSLPDAVGMLFVFDRPSRYGFWMKDMNFSLDLIWMDSNKTVVGVTRNALPTSYPFVFPAPSDVQYVLEMNAGSATTFGLTTGTKVRFLLQ